MKCFHRFLECVSRDYSISQLSTFSYLVLAPGIRHHEFIELVHDFIVMTGNSHVSAKMLDAQILFDESR